MNPLAIMFLGFIIGLGAVTIYYLYKYTLNYNNRKVK